VFKVGAVAECVGCCSQRAGNVHAATSLSASRRHAGVQVLDSRIQRWPMLADHNAHREAVRKYNLTAMALVSILDTGGLTATVTTNVPISSHSRTRKAQILRQARAPACSFPEPLGVNNGHARQAGHAGSIPIAPLRASVCGTPRPRSGQTGSTTSPAERCHPWIWCARIWCARRRPAPPERGGKPCIGGHHQERNSAI
jgi:hypothetical protein